MQRVVQSIVAQISCFYLANSRQMQRCKGRGVPKESCFYLANSRQMQYICEILPINKVVFTLQIVGRCNYWVRIGIYT